MLISMRLLLLFFFLSVVVAVAATITVDDSPMVHHTGRSGTTVQKKIASRQKRLFDVTTEADIVQFLVSDRRPVHCGVLAGGQAR